MPWRHLRPELLESWDQGEHAAISGPTGTGKTHLAVDLLDGRADERDAHVCVFAEKRRDRLISRLHRAGWPVIRSWDELRYEHRVRRRVILWPPYGRASSSQETKRATFVHALDEIMEEGSWTLFLDEVPYFVEQLNLRKALDEIWHGGRSNGITLVGASQGVSWIPVSMRTNHRWMVAFAPTDEEIQKRVAEVAGDRDRFRPILSRLGKREFLLVRMGTDEAYISKVGT